MKIKIAFTACVFAAVFAAGAADLITAREATEIAEGVVASYTVDDFGRALPRYLGAFSFTDTYEEDAAWYFDQLDSFGGACSARRIGNALERNYDWFYDESATFVVSVSASDSRYASIGVASVGMRITADDLKARSWSRYWRCLPGATLDGINSCGVAAEINVVITNGSPWETRGGRDINAVGAVRWVLDHATSAAAAASNLAMRVYIPESMKRHGYSAHFAVCDRNESWIVEDGVAAIREKGVPAVVTNFRVLNPAEPYGTGYERYLTLTNTAVSITSAWFRAAYGRPFSRPTEFAAPGVGTWHDTAALLSWAEANVPQGAPDTLERGGGSWQTVHTSVYDLETKSLRVAVQETDEWYRFSLDEAGEKIARARIFPKVVLTEEQVARGLTFIDEDGRDQNNSVQIGEGAVATIDPAYVERAPSNTILRSYGVAIGYHAKARTKDGQKTQNIAIGQSSRALGINSIAIGSGTLHADQPELEGTEAYADKDRAVAIGYDAKATAKQAIQVGDGVNDVATSFKVFDTWVVRDGKVQAEVDSNAVEKISRDMLEPKVVLDWVDRIDVKSHAITTYAPTNGPTEELEVTPTGSRNYEIYFPNTPDMRASLPVSFDTDIEGEVTKLGTWWTNRILRLPAKVAVKEPLPKTLILEVEEYDVGWDWTPVVTRAYETNGAVRVEGTNLHFTAAAGVGGTVLPVKNPLYGAVSVPTNGVRGVTVELIGKDGAVIAAFAVE